MRDRGPFGRGPLYAVVGVVALVSGLILGAWLGAAPTRAVERPGVQDQTSAATQQADAPEPAVARQETSAIRQPAGETWHEIEVYFSRRPESDHDFTAVFPVARRAPDAGVATGALRELIAGPTLEEAAQGYFSELGTMFVGPSNCGDHDFTIRIENGPEGGTATVRFCRTVTSAGIGQDARVQSALEATLRQFPTIQRVRLLDPAGDCLFDMSGENRCLAAPGDRP